MKSGKSAESDCQRKIIEDVAAFYDVTADYDIANTNFASMIICPLCLNKNVLEIGCGSGEMSAELLKVASSLTIVEPAERYCKIVEGKFSGKVKVHNCFLEDLKETATFDVIVLASVLHHIPEPEKFLKQVSSRLSAGGYVLATTPNVNSLHRQIGVKAGMLQDVSADSERNIRFHQYSKFTKELLCDLFVKSGYEVLDSFGYMLKPFSSEQMMQLKLDWKVMLALFEIGKEHQNLASQIFIKAQPKQI